MTVEAAIHAVSSLSLADQLLVVQQVYDRLPATVQTGCGEDRRAELARRWKEYEANPSDTLSEDEFRKQVLETRCG